MLIQPITNQSNYNNNKIQKRNNTTSFKGEIGARLLKEVRINTVDRTVIENILDGLGMASMGVAVSEVKDIVEEFLNKFTEMEKSTAKKESELNKKEEALINTEHLLKQAETEALKSSIKVHYNIKDPNVEGYYNLPEQCLEISSIINDAKDVKISNLNSESLLELAKSMQNNDGFIKIETMQFLKSVVSMRDFNLNELITVIKNLKDEFGEIDLNKSALFIALYSLNNSSLKSVNQCIKENYGINNSNGTDKINTTENTVTQSKVNSPYTIEEAMECLDKLDIKYRRENDGIVIEQSYNGNPKAYNSHSQKAKSLGINEQEMLKHVIRIEGSADFCRSQVTDLSSLQSIGCWAVFSNSQVTDLSNLQSIGLQADFEDSQVTDLSSLRSIGGGAYFHNSKVTDLGRLRSITKGAFNS